LERELTLQVPACSQAALSKAMKKRKAQTISLQAIYFDTLSRELADARIALRLRLEGEQWIQTLKAPGHDALSRVELNEARPEPRLDLSIYDNTPFAKVFATLREPLRPSYETRIQRQLFRLTHQGSVVELAYDQGTIVAGALELPVHELEVELIQGEVSAVFEVGREWLNTYSLVITLRSKSARGDQLALIAARSTQSADAPTVTPSRLFKARRAQPVQLTPNMSALSAYLACSTECLTQVILNAAVAAQQTAQPQRNAQEPSNDKLVPYTHQLRVGLRRLRSCWKLFKHLHAKLPPDIETGLRNAFMQLGISRDHDTVRLTVKPQLLLAGMPDCVPDTPLPEPARQACDIAASPELQSALLDLLHHLVLLSDRQQKSKSKRKAGKAALNADNEALLKHLRPRFKTWLQTLAAEGAQFTDLPIGAQHDLRKKVKTMRYCMEFCQNVLPAKRLEPMLASLGDVQHALGDLNDYYVAQEHYTTLVDRYPQAWFAIGWLRAMQQQKQEQVEQLLRVVPARL